MCTTSFNERDGRRPFLQIVVLYANDSRVFNYSKEVQNQFLENGIDVYLQIGIENIPSRDNQRVSYHDKIEKDTEIKTENLAEIITSSIADFLIVIGDRNMKNKSCQAKKRGKLVEMNVEDMINGIWSEWSPYQTTRNDGSQENVNIPTEKLQALLDEHFGLKHLNDRITRIKVQLSLVLGKRNEKIIEQPFAEVDGKLATNLTNLQKMFIRLHEPLAKAYDRLSQIMSEDPIIVDQSQYGSKVGPEYRPQHSPRSLAISTKESLLDYLSSIIDKIEEKADAMVEEYGAPLWSAYFTQYKENSEYIMSSEENSYRSGDEEEYDSDGSSDYNEAQSEEYDSENEWESVGSNAKKNRKKPQDSVDTRKLSDPKQKIVTPHPKQPVQIKQILTSGKEIQPHPETQSPRKDPQDYEYKSHSEEHDHYVLQQQQRSKEGLKNSPRGIVHPEEQRIYQEHPEKLMESQYPLFEENFSGLRNHDYSNPDFSVINSLWRSSGISSSAVENDLGPNTFKNWLKIFQPNEHDTINANYEGRVFRSNYGNQQAPYQGEGEAAYNGYPSSYESSQEDQDSLPDFPPESNAKRPCLYVKVI